MKIKALALSLFVAGLGASYALADNGHGRDHAGPQSTTVTASATDSTTSSSGRGHRPPPTTTSPERSRGQDRGQGQPKVCRPVGFELNGTFVAVGSDGSSFSMTVAHANRFAKTFGASPTVTTDARTRIRRAGKQASLADLQAGDRLSVLGRACRTLAAGTAAAGTAPSLLAVRVVARPAKSAPATTTTDTTTTDTTTTDSTTTTDTTTTTS